MTVWTFEQSNFVNLKEKWCLQFSFKTLDLDLDFDIYLSFVPLDLYTDFSLSMILHISSLLSQVLSELQSQLE